MRACPLPALALAFVPPVVEGWLGSLRCAPSIGCRKIPMGTCSPMPLSSLGVRKWAHSIAHTHRKVDFMWMGILWGHLPWSFVFLIGCCLYRDLVIFCISSSNVLLSSYSGLISYSGKLLQCTLLC